jgi:hypothetical protein
MKRKRQVDVLAAAREAGPYDEVPLLPAEVDPQVYLSRNDRTQPFYLVCEHDSVIAQLAGRARVEFKDTSVLSFQAEPGDHVYVPAGTPHRILPETESIQVRYKARDAGWEAVAWYCPACGAQLRYEEWDTAAELPQAAYWRICQAFNGDPASRTCTRCGAVHPVLALDGIRWPAMAAALNNGQA